MVYNRLNSAFEKCGAKLQLLFISLYKLREIFSQKAIKCATAMPIECDCGATRHPTLNIFSIQYLLISHLISKFAEI